MRVASKFKTVRLQPLRNGQKCAPGSGSYEECGICISAEEQHRHPLSSSFETRLIAEEQGCIYFMGSPSWEEANRK